MVAGRLKGGTGGGRARDGSCRLVLQKRRCSVAAREKAHTRRWGAIYPRRFEGGSGWRGPTESGSTNDGTMSRGCIGAEGLSAASLPGGMNLQT